MALGAVFSWLEDHLYPSYVEQDNNDEAGPENQVSCSHHEQQVTFNTPKSFPSYMACLVVPDAVRKTVDRTLKNMQVTTGSRSRKTRNSTV